MAIFKRYKIDRYKEVMINQPTGLVSDGGLSTYTLDQNSDFLGVIRDISLIGEVVEVTMDTGRFTVNQINNTTQAEFDQLVSNGTIRITERIIGWVPFARTRASFYYQECSPTTFVRKQPTSEHYYDFSTFGFGSSLVAGSNPQDTNTQYSIGEAALRPVGALDPNIGNNMGVFGPRFNQMDLQTYMGMVINSTISTGQGFLQNQQGETRPVIGWQPLDGQILSQIQLYLADKTEHFNNPNSQIISNGKFGRNRDVIQGGFRSNVYGQGQNNFFLSTGNCEETTIQSSIATSVVVGPSTTTVTPQVSGPRVVVPGVVEPISSFVSCFPNWKTEFEGIDKVLGVSKPDPASSTYSYSITPAPGLDYSITEIQRAIRTEPQRIDYLYNIRDPREMFNDNYNIPQGNLSAQFLKGCELLVTPNILDKDGTVTEPVGPSRAHNVEKIRKYLQTNYYFYDKTLFRTNVDKNGVQQYSDGKSFREYAAPSAVGWFHENFQATHLSPTSSNTQYCYSLKIPKDELVAMNFVNKPAGYSGEYLEIGQDPREVPDLRPIEFGSNTRMISGVLYSDPTWRTFIDYLRLIKKSSISFIRDNNTDVPVISYDMLVYSQFYDNDYIPVKIVSKTGRYLSSNPCHKTIFLGFNDSNIYDYNDYNRDFLFLLSKENQFNSNGSLKHRNLSYGKNPLYEIGKTNWFDLQRFSNPKLVKNPSGVVFIELSDKTYLLDIYMSLMNVHLAAYPWEIIMKYVDLHDTMKNDLISKTKPRIVRSFGLTQAFPPEISQSEYNVRYNKMLEDIYTRIVNEIPFLRNSASEI